MVVRGKEPKQWAAVVVVHCVEDGGLAVPVDEGAAFDLQRGKVGQMESRGMNQVVSAEVPLSEMFAYSNDLRSKTQGRATYTMQFHSYQPTPGSVQEEIVQRIRGE